MPLDGISYTWEHVNDMYVRNYIVTSRVAAYSFDSGPSTAHRQLCLHDGSLNGSPWYLCVSGSECELLRLGVEPPFYTMYTQQRVRNLTYAICDRT